MKKKYLIAATRGRIRTSDNYTQILELGGAEISNTITSVAKDNFLFIIEE